MLPEKKELRDVRSSERGFEVVELIKEEWGDFVLVKVRLEDLPKLKILKTDKKRREYQKGAQKKYRKRLAAKKKD